MSTTSTNYHNHYAFHFPLLITPFNMAKTKKSADNFSSRLALVMKSGKGESSIASPALSLLTEPSDHGQQIHHEDPPLRQGQAGPHRRQLPALAQV